MRPQKTADVRRRFSAERFFAPGGRFSSFEMRVGMDLMLPMTVLRERRREADGRHAAILPFSLQRRISRGFFSGLPQRSVAFCYRSLVDSREQDFMYCRSAPSP
jgi:hypothetical protein